MHRLFAFVVVLTLASVSSLHADYVVMDVTPRSIGEIEGLEIEAVAGEKGTIAFTVTRKATETPPYRSGRLELFDAPGVATAVDFAPDKRKDRVEFRFSIAPGHLETAEFTLIETAGLGGDMYRFRLKEFAPGKVETKQRGELESPSEPGVRQRHLSAPDHLTRSHVSLVREFARCVACSLSPSF